MSKNRNFRQQQETKMETVAPQETQEEVVEQDLDQTEGQDTQEEAPVAPVETVEEEKEEVVADVQEEAEKPKEDFLAAFHKRNRF